MKRCPVCAELLADDLSVCPFCGEILSNTPPPANAAPQQPASEPMAMEQEKCPFCGEMISSGVTQCPICGEQLHVAPSVSTPQTPPPPPSIERDERRPETVEMKACPVCGEMIDSRKDNCPYCLEPTGFVTAATIAAAVAAQENAMPASAEPVTPPRPEPDPRVTSEADTRITLEPEPQVTSEPTPQFTNQPRREDVQEPFRPSDSSQAGTGQFGVNDDQATRIDPPIPPVIPPVATPQKNNGMKWLLIALIALLALVLGGVLYYFLSKDKTDDEKEPTEMVEAKENNTVQGENNDSLSAIDTTEVQENVADDSERDESAPGDWVEEEPVAEKPQKPAPQPAGVRPARDYDGAYDDVDPYSDRRRPHDGYDRRHRRGMDENEWRERPDRSGRPSRGQERYNEEVAPPQSSGTGFHFERQDGRPSQRGNNGNNGSGFQLQEVDRIPNQ